MGTLNLYGLQENVYGIPKNSWIKGIEISKELFHTNRTSRKFSLIDCEACKYIEKKMEKQKDLFSSSKIDDPLKSIVYDRSFQQSK